MCDIELIGKIEENQEIERLEKKNFTTFSTQDVLELRLRNRRNWQSLCKEYV